MRDIRSSLLQLIHSTTAFGRNPDDTHFNDLALRIFQYQLEHNLPYRTFCERWGQTHGPVRRWEDIPPLPVTAFKVTEIACRPLSEAAAIFHSSGTTREQRSHHPLFDLELSRAAILSHFALHLVPEGQKMRLFILTPSPADAPHASLSHMMEEVRKAFGDAESRYYVERERLQVERLVYDLAEGNAPVCLLGTSFAFVHLMDHYAHHGFPVILPKGSRMMDTGGFKGRSREVSREWIYATAGALWGLPPENCINEYGMAELTSQFYDGVVGQSRAEDAPRVHVAPPQLRTRVLDPETLEPVEPGRVGLLAHYDLANLDSAMAILTEDLGHEVEGGLILLGRATGAAARGCSLTLEDFVPNAGRM
jgi:hypothetical protein